MIYASHNVVGVVVTNCVFQDCEADYVRFRDDSEYCVVDHCTFISTMSASAFPFLSAELYNDSDPGPGNEFFGTFFQVVAAILSLITFLGGPDLTPPCISVTLDTPPKATTVSSTSTQASQLSSGTISFSAVVPANEPGHHYLRHQNVR